jgi:hypothetical protein
MKAQQSAKKEFRIAAAYHEAGHAVAACCLGITVRYATIVPGDGLGGHIKIQQARLDATEAIWEERKALERSEDGKTGQRLALLP